MIHNGEHLGRKKGTPSSYIHFPSPGPASNAEVWGYMQRWSRAQMRLKSLPDTHTRKVMARAFLLGMPVAVLSFGVKSGADGWHRAWVSTAAPCRFEDGRILVPANKEDW